MKCIIEFIYNVYEMVNKHKIPVYNKDSNVFKQLACILLGEMPWCRYNFYSCLVGSCLSENIVFIRK